MKMATSKEGWIVKQSNGITKGWNKKYCILQYNLLLIFDKEPSATSRGQPKKSINLTNCVIRPAEGLHSFGFQVVLPGGTVYALAAKDAADLKDWTEKIKEAAKPAPPSQNVDKKIPDRWEVTSKPNDNNKKGGGGGGGGQLAEKVQQPVAQSYQQPVAQPYKAPAYSAPVQSYQQPVQSYPPQTAPPRADYSAFLNSSPPSFNPELSNLPSAPQTAPSQQQSSGTMFPHLRQYG
jgi:hypothetical protein